MSEVTPQLVVAEVRALLERRRVAQAKARLKGALQKDPAHPELLVQSAWADYMDNDNDAALAIVRQVLAQNPEHQSARLLLFELRLEKNLLGEAEQIILQLLREYPHHAPYYGRYAEVMIRAMLLSKARALAEEGLRYEPDDVGCLAGRALCDFIEQGHHKISYSLQQLLVRHPQSLRTLTLVRATLYHRGHYRGALRIAQELVRAQPDNDGFVRIARELTVLAHWSMLPLWPILRWGRGALIAVWLLLNGATLGTATMVRSDESAEAAGILGIGFIFYLVYAWFWPPILRRWIARA